MKGSNQGMTLVEVVVTTAIASLLMGGITMGVLTANRLNFANSQRVAAFGMATRRLERMRSGCNQALFISRARGVEQRISRTIRQSKYFEIPNAWTLNLYNPDNEQTIIEYVDLDDDPSTIEDNILRCTPPDGEPYTICTYVSAIDADTDMFSIVPTTPKAVRVRIHIGDDLNAENDNIKTGRGYQGVEMRFSATPRNIQYWYD